ncbi:hypothetical protein [Glycomyces harbinensis]|uniref:Uncharacterized protein n=1 Tax=Glycomyces harbinensis TaxID=58114 RepID=A0A1G7ALS5_9ACTN|nr:hypothetical protein [Glycomyces harbinensis]SDE15752.1 hypothetical protein SAMN05216270_11424 [Glycomyces harbinensis]
MLKFSLLAATVLLLSACGQQPDESAAADSPPTMPEMTLSVTEYDDGLEVVMEATVEVASDGSWQRTGTETDAGVLTEEQVRRIDELVDAPDFPVDPDNDMAGTTVVPDYLWSLTTGDDQVSNGNGGFVGSDPAGEIAGIIIEAADVGPTLEDE